MEFARFHGTGRIPWKRLFHESAVTERHAACCGRDPGNSWSMRVRVQLKSSSSLVLAASDGSSFIDPRYRSTISLSRSLVFCYAVSFVALYIKYYESILDPGLTCMSTKANAACSSLVSLARSCMAFF
jgi:hypothetical protein